VPDVSPETFDDSSRRFDCKGLRGPSLLRKIAEGLEATTEPEGIDHDAAEEVSERSERAFLEEENTRDEVREH